MPLEENGQVTRRDAPSARVNPKIHIGQISIR
jgi:hypothetical protein